MVEPLPSVLIIDEIATRASIIEALVSAAGRTRVTLIKEKHGIAANPELTLIETLLIASMLLDRVATPSP